MHFNNISTKDLPEIQELFQSQFHRDCLNEKILEEKLFLENFTLRNGLQKIIIENQLAGFYHLTARRVGNVRFGWIKFFCIHNLNRNLELADKVLKHCEEKLTEAGVDIIRIFDSFPNYLWSGVDPFYTDYLVFFLSRGYEFYHENVNMEVNLEKAFFDTEEEERTINQLHQIAIKRADEKDREKVMDFILEFFPNWTYEVEEMFKNEPVSLHLAFKNGKVVAFSGWDGNNKGTGWFGPMGTRPEFRGLRLGEILLKRCLKDMKRVGFKKSTIPWVGPIGFYHQKVQAYICRFFWQLRKIINPESRKYLTS